MRRARQLEPPGGGFYGPGRDRTGLDQQFADEEPRCKRRGHEEHEREEREEDGAGDARAPSTPPSSGVLAVEPGRERTRSPRRRVEVGEEIERAGHEHARAKLVGPPQGGDGVLDRHDVRNVSARPVGELVAPGAHAGSTIVLQRTS